jgi:uncharacterized SAM-binding protein YcdF (DUF218 family)
LIGIVGRWRRAGVVAAVATLATSAACYRLYVDPDTQQVSVAAPADAILALGGDTRIATEAYRLAVSGVSAQVVISDPYAPMWSASVNRICAQRTGPVTVTCFAPVPSTTQGEARELHRLAERYGWKRVVVLAPAFHISRARLIIGRCFDGELVMVAPPEHYPWHYWLYEFAYQTGGFIKAIGFERDC